MTFNGKPLPSDFGPASNYYNRGEIPDANDINDRGFWDWINNNVVDPVVDTVVEPVINGLDTVVDAVDTTVEDVLDDVLEDRWDDMLVEELDGVLNQKRDI